ncbi:tRNA (adenine(22)-N(1))-methyltransferase [Halobacillus litoralis]|uniref:tRNA (adenine(22)-N(1))-methyltransferase n=1 Tax=Halobacillus litoralis TaxID=45668 RepID=UPI001CFEC12D|nr:tRNA (adenine(22)-N(1))-methyltransferase TrmK [Halobacillus litoralis]
MNVNQLSQRLALVAGFLPKGAYFADIGSDHAYLPCYVCLNDPEAKAVAGEVNKGPFDSALNEVKKHELHDRIDVRLGDGLEVIAPDEMKQIIIAGMGGPLIRDILEKGKNKLTSVERVITQPNIDSRSIRKWYYENGFNLVDETIVEEGGHIYEILVAEKGNPDNAYQNLQEDFQKQLWLGPFLLQQRSSAFIQKCREELDKKVYVLNQMKQATAVNQEKLNMINQEIQWLEEVLHS